MLKRYQVLLEDWLGDHLHTISEKYDISFPEALRIVLCLQIPKLVSAAHSKHKVAISDKVFVNIIKKCACDKNFRERLHKTISDIYFEARKAIEFWEDEEKKSRK